MQRKILFGCILFLLIAANTKERNGQYREKAGLHGAEDVFIYPGQVWLDTDGKPINAHGGCILKSGSVYYWYGEIKSGKTWLVSNATWENYRVNAGGISCYSSADLIHWKNLGTVLSPEKKDSTSDLHFSKVIERPKVIYNATTGKYVMWMHIDSQDYSFARTGVAVSDRPEGPFTYIKSVRPNGNMARDMTIFQNDDGKAYQFYSSEENQTLHICELTPDYLSHTTNDKRILIGKSREAPVVFKHAGAYYLITSGCTGWSANAASCIKATAIMGEWAGSINPFTGNNADSSFHTQGAFSIRYPGKPDCFIFIADRWNKTNLENSRYVWLPLEIKAGNPIIKWFDKWSL